MTWGGVKEIMEDLRDSPNVRLIQLQRGGRKKQEDLYKMTLGTTGHYKDMAGHSQRFTVASVREAQEWIAAREREGGPIDHEHEERTTVGST